MRDVNLCSAVFLLSRTFLIRHLGGFDEAFVPSYYGDTDLCVRILGEVFRIVYDPAVVVHHLECGSASSDLDANAQMLKCRRTFQKKHAVWLTMQRPMAERNIIWARSAAKVAEIKSLDPLADKTVDNIRLCGRI